MAAIAYITDENMLDYHRMNGSHSMVFWRISSKKFSSFKQGDLLFFLSKDNETKRRKEKGVVGCGCYVASQTMTIDAAWKKYKTQTGYANKDFFLEAIQKNCKSEELPEKINLLVLEKVLFFQSPIYLSELGYNISNKVESFIYLTGEMIFKVLNAAKEIGLDSWSLVQNESVDEEVFEEQLIKYQLLTITDDLDNNFTIPSEKINEITNNNTDIVWINPKKQYYLVNGDYRELVCLYYTNVRSEKVNFYRYLGMMDHLKNEISKKVNENLKIRVLALCPLKDYQEELFNKFNNN